MKRFFFTFIFLIIAGSGILIAFSSEINQKLHIEKPEVLKNMQDHPIGYLMDEGQAYNVLYPFFNEVEEFAMTDSVAVFSNEETISLYMDKKDVGNLSYEIINPLTKESLYTDDPSNITSNEKGVKADIKLSNLEPSKRYVLKVVAEEGGHNIYYYQSFYIGNNNQSDLLNTIRKTHSLMFEGDKDYKDYIGDGEEGGSFYEANKNSSEKVLMWETIKDYVKMNEPIPEIISYNPSTGIYEIRMRFTVATRKDYEFEYWDFTEKYTATASNGKVKINNYERYGNKKNEPYFDGTRLQWILDEGYERKESQAILSDSNQYVAFVYKNEIWLLDKTYNELTKIFGFDILDSDYVMDEGDQHRMKLLDIDDKGNIKYLVYGYMSAGDFAGYNGILKNTYSHHKRDNESTLFVKLGIGYQELEYYIENASYFNAENEEFYITIKDVLYSIDFRESKFAPIMSLPSNSTYSEDGIIYSFDNKLKENIGVQLINLTSSVSDNNIKTILFENKYTRVIGTIDKGIIIGTYSLENTYQYLDGSVFYPFDVIYIVDFAGNVIDKHTPEQGTYYQNVNINKQEGLISAATYRLIKTIGFNPSENNVTYEKTNDQTIYQFAKENYATSTITSNEIIDETNHIMINQASISLNEETVPVATNSHKKYVLLDASLQNENYIYEVYNRNKLIGVAKQLEVALRMTSANELTILYENRNGKRKAMFSAFDQPSSILIDVPILAQKPELIRGCEVTALAMFLSYYKQDNISKITLSEQLRKDGTPKTIINGIIHFGDMHKGFVGSVSNGAEPGLGVYVEPIYDLAATYTDNLYNITGASFDQVLMFVGEGRPVWVITPGSYNKVSNKLLENWLTPSGYMEVSFLEHSVVIAGYDETFVYLNDPQQGRVIKQPRISFQIGWENQGSQALVVLD
ncbi:MAG: hypothetical protein CVU84_06340 [Firmicutes bacterium HGW-Firmicutes-1]|jgi:uncharacterized protein YvpB|nr:MAG: hypothetical protein CVU84_06340 [Firmicutes bacterium HGW-Firmicutes-1]